ncbi:MAG: hypothetical protein HKN40_05870 [Winogradskyella sp.]|uniref:hypothetical protein n=1 Tax=Winogradskyella sp. TaxID=1883156 RepID=UPI00182B16EA|nr:hypothetical protein [Winogradskyella sp.]
MKSTELKKMIKEAVKEAIQEELKDILLEAVRSPKQVVQENVAMPTPQLSSKPKVDAKAAYMGAMGETALSFTAKDAQTFRPQGTFDPANGTLPDGNVSMDQIMGLMNSNK